MSQTFIITGASRGIGKAIFLSLIKQGKHCVAIARNENNLQQLMTELSPQEQANASYYAIDVADEKAVIETVSVIKEKHDVITGLINSAGVAELGLFDLDIEKIHAMININLMGTYYFCREVSELMKQQQFGNIINVSSMAAKNAYPKTGMYAASKFAVNGFTEALYREMVHHNVKVTTLCPGPVETDMTAALDLAGELMIRADDLAHTVNYILSLSPQACVHEVQVRCLAVEAGAKLK